MSEYAPSESTKEQILKQLSTIFEYGGFIASNGNIYQFPEDFDQSHILEKFKVGIRSEGIEKIKKYFVYPGEPTIKEFIAPILSQSTQKNAKSSFTAIFIPPQTISHLTTVPNKPQVKRQNNHITYKSGENIDKDNGFIGSFPTVLAQIAYYLNASFQGHENKNIISETEVKSIIIRLIPN